MALTAASSDDNVIAFPAGRRRRPARSDARPPASPRAPRRTAPAGTPLAVVVDSWTLALDVDKSPRTVRSYCDTVRALARWADANGVPSDTEGIETEHIRRFLVEETDRTSKATAACHYRNLSVFWKWVIAERERVHSGNPMANVDRISPPKKAKTFFDDEQLAALLKTCSGPSFEDRRDTALFRIMMDVGVRVGGLVGIRYVPDDPKANDVDLKHRRIRVRLKGGDEHILPLGRKAALAVDRYIRARARHPKAATSTFLFLGTRGRSTERMTESGVYQMCRRRGEAAGIAGCHPHRFRRTWCDDYLEGGGTVDGAMAIGGWSSYDMVREYAGDRAVERARQMHDRLSPGDRI